MGVDGVYDGLKCSSDSMQDGWGTDSPIQRSIGSLRRCAAMGRGFDAGPRSRSFETRPRNGRPNPNSLSFSCPHAPRWFANRYGGTLRQNPDTERKTDSK